MACPCGVAAAGPAPVAARATAAGRAANVNSSRRYEQFPVRVSQLQARLSILKSMTLRFRDDGTFRVLQMADVQDGPDVNADTIRMIEAAIREADPDLVVFTGDQIRG